MVSGGRIATSGGRNRDRRARGRNCLTLPCHAMNCRLDFWILSPVTEDGDRRKLLALKSAVLGSNPPFAAFSSLGENHSGSNSLLHRPDWLASLDSRLRSQEEELTLLKSALADALRRLSVYDQQIPLLRRQLGEGETLEGCCRSRPTLCVAAPLLPAGSPPL